MRRATRLRAVLGSGLLLAYLFSTALAAAGEPAARPFRPFVAKPRLKPGDPKLDLNRATVEELMRLPGIGRKRAEAIVALRQKRPFRRTMEIRRVRGVGKKSLKRLLPLITVGALPAAKPVKARSAKPKPAPRAHRSAVARPPLPAERQ